MLTSELVSALQKVQQIAGDIPVVLRHLVDDVETELQSLGLRLSPTHADQQSSVALEHAPAQPAAVEQPAEQPADQPGDTPPTAG